MAFSGCSIERYLKELTYEHGGAAQAASTLAVHAYSLGFRDRPAGTSQSAAQYWLASKGIILGWATGGLRENNILRLRVEQFCNETGATDLNTKFSVGLQIGRGVPYLVHAIDLLLAARILSDDEMRIVFGFLDGIFQLVRDAANYRAKHSNLDCNRFNNHVSVQIAALLSIARLLDHTSNFEDVAFGAIGDISIPWTLQVTQSIYGQSEPALNCYRNGIEPGFNQTPHPSKGEIVDRYRAGDLQTFGYPMFSLTHLLLSAKILEGAGYQAYSFSAEGHQPLISALHYYSLYFSRLLSDKETRVPRDFSADDREQYVGKILSTAGGATIEGRDGLLLPYLLGRTAFPDDLPIKEVITKGRSFAPTHEMFSGVGSIYLPNLVSV
jgi:hypothetical protein